MHAGLSTAYIGFPARQLTREAQQATLVAQNVEVNQALTKKAVADALTQAPVATPTLEPTSTPLVQQTPVTPTLAPSADPQTATVAAALTQAAQGADDGDRHALFHGPA